MRDILTPGARPGPSNNIPFDRKLADQWNGVYAGGSQFVALANNMALLMGSTDRLLHRRVSLSPAEILEQQQTTAVVLRMTQAMAILGGRLRNAAHVQHRALWRDPVRSGAETANCIL